MKTLIPDGKISRAVREGLELRAKLLADGVDEAEADRIVGQGLKGAWLGRDEPWHYFCEKCKDSGWIIVPPSYWELQRLERMYGEHPQHQDYMQACDPCHWRERQRKRSPHNSE